MVWRLKVTETYRSLFEPLQIKHLTLRNRVMSSSHAPAYAENGRPTERYQRYHEEKVRGGLALTMFGGAFTVAADSPASFGQLNLCRDEVVEDLKAFSARIHALGGALMCQISHAGRRSRWSDGAWLPTIAPSGRREPVHRSFPKPMEDHDFRRVIDDFGSAAARCQAGGLDGIEILVAGHLVGQFLSPLVNVRTDGYGGSVENRSRFCIEVLTEIRRRVGNLFIVGIRFTADEMLEGGIRQDEAVQFAKIVAVSGLVDFFNVNGGNNWTNAGLTSTIPNMASPMAPHLHLAATIRHATNLSVFHAGRIADLSTADQAIRNKLVDMVGMTRAHIADPHLLRKARTGQEERIRPCIGANYCIDRIYVGGDALCLHNAATGREQLLRHEIARGDGPLRKIVVDGAGPAGLEAARVAALRGHSVVVFEAAAEPGGQVLVGARAGWRRDLSAIVKCLADEVARSGAELRCNTYAEAADVIAEQPDVVIIATGGLPNTIDIPGCNLAVNGWDILTGATAPGSNVLVYDDNGQHQGPSIAEFLLARGAKVELASPDRHIASDLGSTNAATHLRNLYRAGAVLTPDRRLVGLAKTGNHLTAMLRNEYSDLVETRTMVDQVIIEHGTIPLDELYLVLRPRSSNLGDLDHDAFAAIKPQSRVHNPNGRFQLFRIGDAVASRNVHAAIYDALRLCSAF
jgi:2,4-dienoyl-CoA reductase-like NADH-dependent reductase (Old Yellow Enzyme family)